jgi:succinoglycan biosynthesis transport protein ExoP
MDESAGYAVTPITAKPVADPNECIVLQPSQRLSPVMLDEDEREFDPWKYWFVAQKRLRLIATVFSGAVMIALLVIFSSTPLYTSSTVVLVKPRIPDILAKRDGGGDLQQEGTYSENYYKTQETILQSRSLAAQVINDLALNHDKVFLGEQVKPPPLTRALNLVGFYTGLTPLGERIHAATAALMSLFSIPTATPVAPSHIEKVSGEVTPRLINRYVQMMRVSIEPGTSLIRIAFTTPDPELSLRLANAHAHAYAQVGIRLHDQADQEAEKFLQTKLVDLRARLEKSEIELNKYRRAHDIIPGLMSLDGKETVVLDRIRDLSKELTAAELERIGLEAQVEVIKKGNSIALPAVSSSLTIQNLQTTLNSEYVEIASLSNQFKPGYPPLAQVEARAKKTRENLNIEIERVANATRSSYEVALGKERELRAEMDKQKQEALSLNDAAVKYAMLQREVDTNRELTNNVLQKMKDVGLEAESEASNVSVVDPAEINSIPSSPRKAVDISAGGMTGLLAGLLLAFTLEYLGNTLSSPDEVEKFLQLPNLGVVPEISDARRPTELRLVDRPRPSLQAPSGNRQLVNSFKPYSMVTEAYRSIRTGLLLSRAGSPPKLTLVTSAMSGEGKTLTAINTAMMLAQVGAKVLLVDSDLRRGCCHTVLGMPPSAGLTEVLIGAAKIDQLVCAYDFPNLSVLQCGSKPPNSTELVGSDRMRQLLAELAVKYDFVVVDSPPLIPVSDSMLLSRMVDGVVLVVDSARTPKKQIRAARTRLDYAGAKIFGFVINRMHPKSFHYHYYYGDYYLDESRTG